VVVIINASLVDGARAFARNATVVLRDGRISEIAEDAAPPAGATVIDARGRFLLPGLIDAHTHVASLSAARRALESGVTTIRSASVGAFQDVALREAVKRGSIAGPDVLAAGVFVTLELGETILADPRLSQLAAGVTSEAALRQLVRINSTAAST
jgi:imidazolonepropionase-like amidohydrolase